MSAFKLRKGRETFASDVKKRIAASELIRSLDLIKSLNKKRNATKSPGQGNAMAIK